MLKVIKIKREIGVFVIPYYFLKTDILYACSDMLKLLFSSRRKN